MTTKPRQLPSLPPLAGADMPECPRLIENVGARLSEILAAIDGIEHLRTSELVATTTRVRGQNWQWSRGRSRMKASEEARGGAVATEPASLRAMHNGGSLRIS